MKQPKQAKLQLEIWNGRIAIALILVSFATYVAISIFSQAFFTAKAGLIDGKMLVVTVLGGGAVALLSSISVILQVIAWAGWLRTSQTLKLDHPPLWHVVSLLLGALILAAPTPEIAIKVTLPPSRVLDRN